MRFLFISPYDERCLGLRSIGAVLHADGHEVHYVHIEGFVSQFAHYEDTELAARLAREHPLVSPDVEPLGDLYPSSQRMLDAAELELLLGHVGRLRPDAVGLSAWIGLEALCGQVTGALRERYPALRIIWGGTLPTLFPEAALERSEIICVGEGERALREWAAAPARRDIPGLWFRSGGEVHKNGPAPAPDLDSLPLPLYRHNELTLTRGAFSTRQMDDLAHIGRNVIFAASRYCRFDCAYCLSGRMRRQTGRPGARRMSVKRFLDEIEYVSRLCRLPDTLAFWDDNFAEDPQWANEFAREYPRRIGRPFAFNTHPAHTTRETLGRLIAAGAREIALGLQSGSRRLLREVYQRDSDLDLLIDMAHFIHGQGIARLQIDLITNCPYETEADCRATLETLLRLPRPCDVHVAKLVIYPGSRLADYQGPHGGLTDRDFDFWNMLYLMAGTGELSARELWALADDPHLRQHPWILRKMAHALKGAQERQHGLQQTVDTLQNEIEARDHLLEHSCHKKLGAIVLDKIRYRIARWRAGGRP